MPARNNNYNNNNSYNYNNNCLCEVVDKQLLQILRKCEGHSTVFDETCSHFGIIWHLGLKNLTVFS